MFIPKIVSLNPLYLVVGIGLENSTYYTSENEGSVMVCAQVTGPQLGRIFTVNLTTQDGTAQSISKPLYIHLCF